MKQKKQKNMQKRREREDMTILRVSELVSGSVLVFSDKYSLKVSCTPLDVLTVTALMEKAATTTTQDIVMITTMGEKQSYLR
jgi:uncharacterized protein